MVPPPSWSLLFLGSTGRFRSRATIGYPLVVPNDESFVLSAYCAILNYSSIMRHRPSGCGRNRSFVPGHTESGRQTETKYKVSGMARRAGRGWLLWESKQKMVNGYDGLLWTKDCFCIWARVIDKWDNRPSSLKFYTACKNPDSAMFWGNQPYSGRIWPDYNRIWHNVI
jgi:hypothetical protein